MKIAMTGNPNSGKTTMFNALTGCSEKVGNWAGVTVDIKEHPVKKIYSGEHKITAVDLPGTYSISPFTGEEQVTRDYIVQQRPDVIVNIVDADNLGRSLFFTTQLLELGIPVVVAMNKSDIGRKKGTKIDSQKLAEKLGCPVVKTVSTTAEGLDELIENVISSVGKHQKAPYIPEKTQLKSKSAAQAEDRKRFAFVTQLVRQTETRKKPAAQRNFADSVDDILLNKYLGIPIFALVMFLVFFLSQTTLGTWIAEGYTFESGRQILGLVPILELFQEWVRGLLTNAAPLLTAILVDGVIGGLVAVVGFLPLVMVMYFLIALLEDCGYMSRAAVVLDPIFKRVGLSGRSVIPFVLTIGCAVPGVMASRTIRDDRERRAAAMLAPFMPCGAKIPVIALFAGAFFDGAWWVSALMYFAGIVLIFLGALLINWVTGRKGRSAYFIMELPDYKTPSISGAFWSMISRGWEYIVKASTVILLCNMAVQLMQSFTWNFQVAETADQSILALVASPFAYMFVPIVGVLSWQLAAAAITGFIAKENVVGTLAVCFVGLENLVDTEELALLEGAGAEVAGIMAITKVAALAYLMFNLYSPPCFAAIGAMHAEMKSGKWLWGGIGLQLGLGYTVAYVIYTVGTLLTGGSLHITAALAGLAFVLIFAVIVYILGKSVRKGA